MSSQAVCTACGKTFTAAAPTPLCPDCRAAAVSERPMPAPPAVSTGIQPGMPPSASPANPAESDVGDIRRPPVAFWPTGCVTLALIGAVLAMCIVVLLVCA